MASNIEDTPLSVLVFDPKNPRLVDPDSESELDQMECAQRLYDRHDPINIARSLAWFGFFPSDPLIGIPGNDGTITVVEGNRRLLAVKLLVDSALREQIHADDEWDDLAEQAAARGHRFQTLPLQQVASRGEAAPVIGFRHIVGIKKWGAWEKAAFVKQLLSDQADPSIAFDTVSRLTGEGPGRIKRYLRDYLVVQQADNAGLSTAKGAKGEFGVFTRALNTAGIREYLGVRPAAEVEPKDQTAYTESNKRADEVLGFLFGDEDKGLQPVLTDTRRVQDLGRVLQDESATEHLITTRSLPESLAMTGAARERLLGQFARAYAALGRAKDDLPNFRDDEAVLASLRAVYELAEALLDQDAVRVDELVHKVPAGSSLEPGDYDLDSEDETLLDDE